MTKPDQIHNAHVRAFRKFELRQELSKASEMLEAMKTHMANTCK